METKIITYREGEEELLREAGEILKSGGLVAFPTETVYGLGGDALNRESSRKIYAAKGRPSDNPLIVHIAGLQDLDRLVTRVPSQALKLAENFWPGPLTMILPKSPLVPYETTGGLDTVAVRMPSHPAALGLIRYGGGYVAAPSANQSGRPSPTLAKHVAEDLGGRIDMIIDGGPVGIGLESTIVDLTVDPPQILRPGYITRELLESVLGQVEVDPAAALATAEALPEEDSPGGGIPASGGMPEGPDPGILASESAARQKRAFQELEPQALAPRAPGMKYRHYAPRGELTVVAGEAEKVAAYINARSAEWAARGKKVGVIAARESRERYRADAVKCAGSRGEEASIARNLYRILREFDEENVEIIFSEFFEGGGFGQAIMNRLLKAAGHRVVTV